MWVRNAESTDSERSYKKNLLKTEHTHTTSHHWSPKKTVLQQEADVGYLH